MTAAGSNIAGVVLLQELPHLSHLGVRARQANSFSYDIKYIIIFVLETLIRYMETNKVHAFMQEKVIFVTCEDEEKVSDIQNLAGKYVRLSLNFSAV